MNVIIVTLCFFCVLAIAEAFLTDQPYCNHGDYLPNVYCGPGSTGCPDDYSCHVHPADADRWAVCCPKVHVGTRTKRSNSQIDILKNKLANLQGLLQQIEKGEEQAIKTTLPPTVKPESINKAKESAMVTSKTTDTDKSDDSLTSDEVAVLMALKNTLNRQRQQKLNSKIREELENKESFYDKPIVEKGTDDAAVLKSLASKLSKVTETKQNVQQRDDKEDLSQNKEVQPKEGKFSLYRQEVLAQIEDRLLQDMDFALKTGFTVEEILTDLQEKEKRFEELKMAEMTDRIERLRKLRNRD
ncbi:uncharacterized protein LOC134718353 [Mytilus trossulus]|uniref:uncharacterized protein LOC134718353 n=1 Tax=Mytilus trossulus TaxID=6551 RepID=UPI00300503C1